MLVVGQLHPAKQLLRCPWLLHARSLGAYLTGRTALSRPPATCRVVVTGALSSGVQGLPEEEEGTRPSHTLRCCRSCAPCKELQEACSEAAQHAAQHGPAHRRGRLRRRACG